jgi:uncharacterized protein (DUF2252 family)
LLAAGAEGQSVAMVDSTVVPLPDSKAAGKAARAIAPLAAHAEFRPAEDRDPVGLLLRQAETRVPELVPVRHGRMLVSPFTFYRGAALVMAADLGAAPSTGLRVQLCGDAHLSNFGAYASPERNLVFDINDFDETYPGPFEWDVKRLAASLTIAGQDNGFDAGECRAATLAAVERYRLAMREFAGQPILDVWYAHLNVDDAWAEFTAALSAGKRKKHKQAIRTVTSAVAKSRTRTSLQAIGKLTTVQDGRRRILADPPLVVPLENLTTLDPATVRRELNDLVSAYRRTLPADRRVLLDHFTLTDVAHKVVGVGSVGTRAWILLFEGRDEGEALVLQAKEAQESVLADYTRGGPTYANQGERVVAGQLLMQASSDIFLGWLQGGRSDGSRTDYYLRQLRDWKLSAEVEQMGPASLVTYARMCGWTLARAHARSGDRVAIAAYLGKSAEFESAVTDFAEAYARQNEKDYAELAAAVASGRVQATAGV